MSKFLNRVREGRTDDSGFTLVELLVVVVIIGILVAIAIPVFLNQREKAWTSAVESDLRNAAPIAEGYFADTGTYTGLTKTSMLTSEGVTLTIATANDTGYCINATHTNLSGETWSLNSATGRVVEGACAA